MAEAKTKVCADCGVELDAGFFYKDTRLRSGLSTYCKKHHSARSESCRRVKLEKHPDYYSTRNRLIKLEAVNKYGGCCYCCREKTVEFLAIDHEQGGGNKHRKLLGIYGGVSFYKWLKRKGWPSGYRVAYHNCNLSTGVFGYCPHKKEL